MGAAGVLEIEAESRYHHEQRSPLKMAFAMSLFLPMDRQNSMHWRFPFPLRLGLLALLLVGGAGLATPFTAVGQEMAGYYDTADFLDAPPATVREGLLGYANPAVPAVASNQLLGVWNTDGRRALSVRDWGMFGSVGGLGAGVVHRDRGPLSSTAYHVSLAGGSDAAAVGVGYQGFGGDATPLGRYNRITTGTVLRPSPYVSVGLTGNVSLETDDREVVGELGLRPFGTSRLTLFADAAWAEGEALVDVPWSAGAAVEVSRGIDLTGRVFESDAVSVGLRVAFGRTGLGSRSDVAPNGDYDGQTTRVRVGADVPSAIGDAVGEGKSHVEVQPKEMPYRAPRFSLRDDAGPRYYEVLRTLRQAQSNDRTAAVALDLTNLSVSREKAWELRTAVQEVQAAGKEVVAFLENAGMEAYHVASAADRVAVDPQGTLQLPGYASSRTFVKGTLDKIGLGVQPFRFFEYKSAAETLTRAGFSEADSLQRQQLVDDWYRLARTGIADGRSLSPDTVDHLIDDQTILSATDAREAGLVDTLARWHEREALLSDVTEAETSAMDRDRLNALATATSEWGTRPEIAVVYGIGATSLNSGIEARNLADTFRQLKEDDNVKAVVFRVDSPGGSALAADVAAQAVRECAAEKPVIVSQGTVAASGGYLISTYADQIFAGPNTVTGSIGVIGLWVYDDGLLRDKVEASYDVVQQGARAELFAPYRVPLLGLPLPTRKLEEDELARARSLILQSYDDFVGQVAAGRDTSEAYVRSVGEGRVYSGTAGQQRALVDDIGGMTDALAAARQAAGVPADRATLREVNATSGVLSLPSVLPSGLRQRIGTERDSDETPARPTQTFLRTVVEHQPDPLLLLPPGYYADPEDVR